MVDKKAKMVELEDMELEQGESYLGNKRIPRADIEIEWTPEKIKEVKKCKENILHFAENYFYITDIDEGLQKIDLYPAQRRVVKALEKYRFNVICASRQVGKCCLGSTKIKIKNKKTNEIKEITIEEFYNLNKKDI